MLFFVIGLLGMIVLLERYSSEKLCLLKLEHQYRLFALRDKLRLAVIDESIQADKWFDCLDTTLTRVIGQIDHVNIYELTGVMMAHWNDPELREALEQLKKVMEDPKNKNLAELYKRYTEEMLSFLYVQHTALIRIVSRTDRFYRWTQTAKDRFRDTLLSAPETSTLVEHS